MSLNQRLLDIDGLTLRRSIADAVDVLAKEVAFGHSDYAKIEMRPFPFLLLWGERA